MEFFTNLWLLLLDEFGNTGISLVDKVEGFTCEDGSYSALLVDIGTKSHGFGLEVEIEMVNKNICGDYYFWQVRR